MLKPTFHKHIALAATLLVAGRGGLSFGQEPAQSESAFGVVCPWPGIREAGIKWCRVGAGATAFCNWVDIEKSPGKLDWTASDNEVRQLIDTYHVSPLPIFGYTPKWASREPNETDCQFAPPKDLASLKRFVRQCVARYKHQVRIWEVWNEPNISFFRGSAAEYAEMVKAVATAARQEDPDCRVAMGCAGVDIDFLSRLFEFGCAPYVDVISVHPYQWGKEFNDGWMLDKLRQCRELMNRHGGGDKEIWITEMGWSLGEGVTAQEQANLLAQAVITALSAREQLKVEKVFWFCVKDWGSPGHGLFDVNGKRKPALTAYETVIAGLEGARYRGPWKAPTGVRGRVFERGAEPVLALWHGSAAGKQQVVLNTAAPRVQLRSLANQVANIPAKEGKALIEATHAPVLVSGLSLAELGLPASPIVPTAPATSAKAPLSRVWVSVLPPATTARPTLVLGASNALSLRIHNDQSVPAPGELQLELGADKSTLCSGRVSFQVAPDSCATSFWHFPLAERKELVGQLAQLRIRGSVKGEALAPIDLPVRLVRSTGIEFAANSWVEKRYLHRSGNSGCGDGIRFGSEFTYRFDLRDMEAGTLRMNVGANGANPWNLHLSTDDKTYVTERSGKSWPAWQTINLDRHLGATNSATKTLYVKIQGNDCQLREVVVEAGAREKARPASASASPSSEVARPPTSFKDVTAALGLKLGADSACWVDVDNDGWVDLCASGVVWRNNAGANFTRLAEVGLVVAADFDKDGFVDLFSWSGLKLHRNDGGKRFVEFKLPELPKCASRGACWGDFNGDGFVDLYVGGFEDWDAGITYPSLVLTNEQGKSFRLAWTDSRYRARGVTACDFNRDGRLDVYVSNYRLQPNLLWLNDGTAHFKEVAAEYNVVATSPGFEGGHSIGAAWGDFDNDGNFDLFAGNFAHRDNRGDQPKSRFLRNLGPEKGCKFEDRGTCGVFYQESYASPTAGDYDNDGNLDLFFTTVYGVASFNQENHPVLFRNQGRFVFTDVTPIAKLARLGPTSQAAWADFDRDGNLDLVTDGRLFRNSGGGNHWLEVRLAGDGRVVNRSAIAAQVRVKVGDSILSRQVEAGTGEGNQNDLTLHFGLGSRHTPADLEIFWPNGATQTIANVAVDRLVEFNYPTPR